VFPLRRFQSLMAADQQCLATSKRLVELEPSRRSIEARFATEVRRKWVTRQAVVDRQQVLRQPLEEEVAVWPMLWRRRCRRERRRSAGVVSAPNPGFNLP
jgi:hypothetical protein